MLASPDFITKVHTESVPVVCDAVLVVPHRHHQFLLDVSRGPPPVGSSAPAHHSGPVVPEHGSSQLSVLSQVGSEELGDLQDQIERSEPRYSRGKTDGVDEVIVDGGPGESDQHDVILRHSVEAHLVVRVNPDLGHSDVLTTVER